MKGYMMWHGVPEAEAAKLDIPLPDDAYDGGEPCAEEEMEGFEEKTS